LAMYDFLLTQICMLGFGHIGHVEIIYPDCKI
jgi:hypothetical protein